jgi:hypothetical protein
MRHVGERGRGGVHRLERIWQRHQTNPVATVGDGVEEGEKRAVTIKSSSGGCRREHRGDGDWSELVREWVEKSVRVSLILYGLLIWAGLKR